jgi:undecaprenyl phosphate-alpha-L-ara4N flippase subunit ArnF
MVSRPTARLLILASLLLTTAAQLMFRLGMQSSGLHELFSAAGQQEVLDWLFSTQALVVAGGVFCYGVSLLCWVVAISRFDLSVAYPLLSVTYVLVYVVAVNWPGLGEQPSLVKLGGIGLIMLGVALVAGSGRTRPQGGGDAA